MKFHVKKNDEVLIIAGEDKGKKGRIIDVDRKNQRVFVDGVNLHSKHTKPNAKNPNGGIIKNAGSVHISNVQLMSEGKGTRVGRKEEKGKTVRVSKKTGKIID
ncbi:MAG TPA: 50S ribosomal protein L24 [Chitinophagales bacterium]|nr:50S ribosomal protein L24 [Chitinophagales bacterium]